MFKLIKNGNVFTPDKLGQCDILIAADKIVQIAEKVKAPENLDVEIIDATGKFVVPGFVESHTHFLGAGGIDGPSSRSSEASLSAFARAGITTAISPLGSDHIANHLPRLLIKARALEQEGLTTYILTGGFHFPLPNLTGSIITDLSFIDKIIGVKMAMFEKNASRLTPIEYMNTIRDVRLGAKMGNKAGVIHTHIGERAGSFEEIAAVYAELGIPASMFVATHVNQSSDVLKRTLAGAKRGLCVDITATMTPDRETTKSAIPPGEAVQLFLDAGIPLANITMSSDSNAGVDFATGPGTLTPIDAAYREMKKMILAGFFTLEDALKLITLHPAQRYGLEASKGSLEVSKAADLVLLTKELDIDTVLAKGKFLLKNGQVMARSVYEESYLRVLQ
ncbi:MAG: amidohydrolase family protein [Peptococcaceae bacterium]